MDLTVRIFGSLVIISAILGVVTGARMIATGGGTYIAVGVVVVLVCLAATLLGVELLATTRKRD